MIDLGYPKKLLELGDKDGAIKELASLLRQQPQNVNAWFLLAQALDDRDKKVDCYRQVLRVDPDNLLESGVFWFFDLNNPIYDGFRLDNVL
jgi:tetratricopeptide (TPR) repeat protein